MLYSTDICHPSASSKLRCRLVCCRHRTYLLQKPRFLRARSGSRRSAPNFPQKKDLHLLRFFTPFPSLKNKPPTFDLSLDSNIHSQLSKKIILAIQPFHSIRSFRLSPRKGSYIRKSLYLSISPHRTIRARCCTLFYSQRNGLRVCR